MKAYLERARSLLEASRANVNPFEDFKPEVPSGIYLKPGEDQFDAYEEMGLKELSKMGIVLIAGGLGERLGYSGIKIDLPVCTIEEDYCYLRYYINYAKACEQRAQQFLLEEQKKDFYVPFCIMVSGDTHDRTI